MPTTAPARLLLVEDDPTALELLAAILEPMGYEVAGRASSGEETIAALKTLRPDLVLLDIGLAGAMDGIQTASKLRESSDVPVVFVTGQDDESVMDRAKSIEPSAFLLKPFRPVELRAAVDLALEQRDRQRKQDKRQRTIAIALRAIDDAIITVDTEARITLMNDAAEHLTRLREKDTRGRRIGEVLRFEDEKTGSLIEDTPSLALRLRHNIKPRAAVLVTPSGRHVVEDGAAPLVDEEDRMFGAVMVIRDVAALRTLQKQIALSDRLIALGTLAGGVAHEINTPTQYIGDSISFVQTAFEDLLGLLPLYREATEVLAAIPEHRALAQRIAEAEEAADLAFIRDQLPEAFTRTRHGVERIATIVRAVKAMGHPGGRERQPADLTEIVRNTLIVAGSEYRHLADIETRFDPMDAISCYPSELSQAILNLIVNAAQAIRERSEPSERGLIRVVLEKVASSAVISITDTGCGISPAIADRIFDPFFTTKPVGKGTGQGLTIARAVVVDKHGGELTFFSEPGKGSTFIVRLPMKVSASA